MILLFADHYCLGDEKKPGAFVLYSSVVISAAAAGFEREVNSGMVVFVFVPCAYEACVVKGVSLRMAQSLEPADSSAALMLGV